MWVFAHVHARLCPYVSKAQWVSVDQRIALSKSYIVLSLFKRMTSVEFWGCLLTSTVLYYVYILCACVFVMLSWKCLLIFVCFVRLYTTDLCNYEYLRIVCFSLSCKVISFWIFLILDALCDIVSFYFLKIKKIKIRKRSISSILLLLFVTVVHLIFQI